jgi:hypothetical protein
MVRLASGAAYASFAGLILRLGAAVCLAFLDAACLYADQWSVAAEEIKQGREPNSRIVLDPNGQQIAEIRWQPGRAGPIGILRVPVVTYGGVLGC